MAVGFDRTAILLLLVATALWRCSSAAIYNVGDSLGWTVPPNLTFYSDWVSTKTFVVGDILVFTFESGRDEVTEVTRSAFDSCNSTNPISVRKSSPVRIRLTSAGDRYFICSFFGHCPNGQKLSIAVTSATPSPAPSPIPVPIPPPTLAPVPSSSTPLPSPSPSSTPPSPVLSREPTTYIVGDSFGWNVPTNPTFFDSWARGKTFVVGDVLEFNFMVQSHNVAKVTKDNFSGCIAESPISLSTGPPVRITLSESGEHFFIWTFAGHCYLGQKLAVNVSSTQSPTTGRPSPLAATLLRASAFSTALTAVAIALSSVVAAVLINYFVYGFGGRNINYNLL